MDRWADQRDVRPVLVSVDDHTRRQCLHVGRLMRVRPVYLHGAGREVDRALSAVAHLDLLCLRPEDRWLGCVCSVNTITIHEPDGGQGAVPDGEPEVEQVEDPRWAVSVEEIERALWKTAVSLAESPEQREAQLAAKRAMVERRSARAARMEETLCERIERLRTKGGWMGGKDELVEKTKRWKRRMGGEDETVEKTNG
jgi:hypothetical protein